MTDDLLALLIEVSSVTASGKQLRKPLEIPRPKAPEQRQPEQPQQQQAPVNAQDAAFKKGIGVLASSSRAVKR